MALSSPPKLTKQQFLRKPPINPVAGRSGQQRYQAYLNAYNRQSRGGQAGRGQNALPTLNSLLMRVGQFETPAQLEARANRMANQGITAQQAIIREEAKLMRDEAQRRMTAMAAAGRAAAAQNAGLFGQVGGEYNAAAQEIRGLGTNLAGGIAAGTAADVAAQNAGLAAVGQEPLAVGGPVTGPGLAGPAQAGVEAYRGAELPAQAIGTAGQAAQFGLAGLVSSQNLRATQEAQAAFVEATRTADQSRTAALKELAAGRPAQAAQFLQQLQEAQRQQIGLASGLIQQRAAMQQQGFEQGMTKKDYQQKVQQQAFQNQVTLSELAMKQQGLNVDLSQVDPTRSAALGYVVDKRGVPILKNGKRIPYKTLLKALGGTSKGRSMTPGQRVDLLQNAQSLAETLFFGYGTDAKGKRVPVTQLGKFDPNDPSTWGNGTVDYAPALQRLMSMGLDRPSAESILTSYYERGDRGRPVFSPQEEKILRKRMGPKKLAWAKGQVANLLSRGQIAAAQSIINEVIGNFGKNLAWVGPK